MIKGYQSDILKIYEAIREENASEQLRRREEIEKKVPKILEIEKHIGKLCLELSMSALKTIENREDYLNNLRNKITELRIQKSELLVAHGYDMEYLSHRYRCDKCNDTGFIVDQKCTCYKQLLVDLYYKNSDLRDMLRINNFDTFQMDYYSQRRAEDQPESPRKNMERNVTRAWSFINSFKSSSENLLFYGNSGTGKTFLSHCIAKELLDKGVLVVYRTAEELIQNLRQIRFDNDSQLEDLILNCDLLIIDDLGTENVNDFSKTELFNLLNKKLLRGKKMLVSTNYTIEGLSKTYSERITSRLFGSFTLCKFYGDDIRVKINLNKMKQM